MHRPVSGIYFRVNFASHQYLSLSHLQFMLFSITTFTITIIIINELFKVAKSIVTASDC